MRPVGSANGRIPEGGYPEVTVEIGAFLAGFIEGEGCFTISRQTRGYGYRPAFTLAARADDGDLVRTLHAATNVGRITNRRAYRTSKPQKVWNVTAKSDCRRLVEILDAHPLIGRKADSYVLWREAVLSWVGSDPRLRVPNRRWGQFPAWKQDLSRVKRFAPEKPLVRRPSSEGSFLAGLATAEGYFSVQSNGAARFAMHMRADDAPMLRWFQKKTGLGKVSKPAPPSGNARHPSVTWNVVSHADTLTLASLFESFQPGGRKLLEFLIWRGAVIERSHGSGWSRERVEAVRQHLRELRIYREPRYT
jgi:LAGLIDADG endonuclease